MNANRCFSRMRKGFFTLLLSVVVVTQLNPDNTVILHNVSDLPHVPDLYNIEKRPIFLWGIFSINNVDGFAAREVIRATYLSYYKTLPGVNSSHADFHRICSLTDYRLWHKKKDPNYWKCEVAYAFVLGSNSDSEAPTNLCQATQMNPSYPLTVNESDVNITKHDVETIATETDLVHLNIRENMELGKSISWFHYCVSLMSELHHTTLDFDYIAKLDSDKLIFPDAFFQRIKNLSLPIAPASKTKLVYGGYPYYSEDNVANLEGLTKFYMSGELYFLSQKLARYVTSSGLNRTALEDYCSKDPKFKGLPAEDLSMGKFVFSHPHKESIRAVSIGRFEDFYDPTALHDKQVLKIPSEFKAKYERERGWGVDFDPRLSLRLNKTVSRYPFDRQRVDPDFKAQFERERGWGFDFHQQSNLPSNVH